MSERVIRVDLRAEEIELLLDSLDSHEYWELSETAERSSGFSTIGDGESEKVDAVRQLISKLERCSAVEL